MHYQLSVQKHKQKYFNITTFPYSGVSLEFPVGSGHTIVHENLHQYYGMHFDALLGVVSPFYSINYNEIITALVLIIAF